GTSPGRHPYYHAASSAAVVVDLLHAARRLAELAGYVWPEELFLAGFSQGGHPPLAAMRALEAADEPGLRGNSHEMFQPAFLAGFREGRPSWLRSRLRENDLVDFTPRAPVRAYYGRSDVDVSTEGARA